MPEFAKIAIAFLLGIVAEPIRAIVMSSYNGRKLRRALYMELARLHRCLVVATSECEAEAHDMLLEMSVHRLRTVTFDAYRNAKVTKPEFYDLPDAVRFDEVFGNFEYAVKSPPALLADNEMVMHSAKACLHFIDKYLQDGRFNDDIFHEVYPEYRGYLAQKGKRP